MDTYPNSGSMRIWFKLLCLCVASERCWAAEIGSFMGPFDVVPKRLERCPPELDSTRVSPSVFDPYRITRVGVQSFVYNGNITLNYSFANDKIGEIRLASWSSRGGWKENAHVMRLTNMCTSLKTYLRAQWDAIVRATHDDPHADCPFKPQTFHVKNATVNLRVGNIPVFFYGRWRALVRVLFADGDVAGCIRAYVDTVPRLSNEKD